MKKKKILFLLNSLEHGGTERVVTTLADSIKNKYEVKIYTLFDIKTFETNVEHHALLKVKNPLLFFPLWPLYSFKLKKIINEEKPDILISFLEFSNLLNITTKKKIKTIISTRSHVSNVYRRRKSRLVFVPLIKHFYKNADVLLVNSSSAKNDLVDNFNVDKEKINVIYNPVNIEKVEKLSKESIEREYMQIFNKKSTVLVTLGRLGEEKAHRNLIKIINNINPELNIKLAIIGDGILKKELECIIKKWKLEKKVFLLGDKKNPFKYLKNSNIFVFTSFYEGMPNAMLEAMACGLPILSVDCKTGPREILAPETNTEKLLKTEERAKYGILTPMFDQSLNPLKEKELSGEENIFKKALENLIQKEELRKEYSKKALERIKDFQKEKIVKKFTEFVENQT